MTWHRFFRISLILGVLIVGSAPPRGARAATLPNDVRTATNSTAIKPKVEAFLEPKIADLGSADTSVRSAAREAIVAEVGSGSSSMAGIGGINAPSGNASGSQPSAAFLDAYADVLAEKLDPLATNPDPRIRLNVAVITAKVGEKANNQRLMPIVVKQLADDNEGVVIWAVKASKYIIPSLLNSSTTAHSNLLVPALAEAAKAHIKSGQIVQSAYDSLRIEQSPSGVTSAAWPTAVQVVVPVMQELLTMRLDQYKDGMPELPLNETAAATFLTDEKVWKAESPPSQLHTVQLITNLIGEVAQRLGSVGTVEGGELRKIIQRAAGALIVVGRWVGEESQMRAAANPLSTMSPSMSVEEVQAKANALVPGLNKIKVFQNVQPLTKAP
jgi:hypothetical protein